MMPNVCPFTLQSEDDEAAQKLNAALPDRVASMREKILEAAEGRDLNKLRAAIERNEVMPLFGETGKRAKSFATAIDFLKAQSFDKEGREIFDLLRATLYAPYRLQKRKPIDVYVWPVHAVDEKLAKETPRADLYRFVAFGDLQKIGKNGFPPMHRIEIGADGTWHLFATG